MEKVLLTLSFLRNHRYLLIAVIAVMAATIIMIRSLIIVNDFAQDTIVLEEEIVSLNNSLEEFAMFEHENKELTAENDALEVENDTLAAENDKLAADNGELERQNGDLSKKYDGLKTPR